MIMNLQVVLLLVKMAEKKGSEICYGKYRLQGYKTILYENIYNSVTKITLELCLSNMDKEKT